VGCCAGWVPLPPEDPLCLFAARLAWGDSTQRHLHVPSPQQHPWVPPGVAAGVPYLLDGGEALELGAGEVLLLQRGRLQHQVLLLRRVHLLQVLRRRVGLPVQRLLDHLSGRKHVPGLRPDPETPPKNNPPHPETPYLDGLAVGDAAVDGDLGRGRAGAAGAAGRGGGAGAGASAAGGRRCRELLVLHGALPGCHAAAGVRLELGGGHTVRGGTPRHPTWHPRPVPSRGVTAVAPVPMGERGPSGWLGWGKTPPDPPLGKVPGLGCTHGCQPVAQGLAPPRPPNLAQAPPRTEGQDRRTGRRMDGQKDGRGKGQDSRMYRQKDGR